MDGGKVKKGGKPASGPSSEKILHDVSSQVKVRREGVTQTEEGGTPQIVLGTSTVSKLEVGT